jgi:carboxylesterase type B
LFSHEQPNLIEGNYEGLVSHELDVTYLFGNLSSYFSQESKQLGKDMAEVWINFAYGDGWGSKLHDDDILVIGPDERMVFTTPEGYDQTFRHGRDRALQEIGWAKCFRLGEKLQGLP